MNLWHGNKFSPSEDFFNNPFSSDDISPNHLYMYEYRYRCWSKHMQWNRIGFAPGKYNCFVKRFTSGSNSMVGVLCHVITKSSKKRDK